MIKLAFFDMDGTLCVPYYVVGDKVCIGFSDEEWYDIGVEQGENLYDHCQVVPVVKRYAEELKAQGAKLYVLSSICTSYEAAAKNKFIKEHFPGMFEDCLYVGKDHIKLHVMRKVAEKNNVPITECELVEDSYGNLLAANTVGIKCTHISKLITDKEEKEKK